ncbi:MAG: O-antigen ligase family protein [bacterium]
MDHERILFINEKIMRGALILYLLIMTIPGTASLRSILMVIPLLCLIFQGIVTKRFPIQSTPLDLPILFYAAVIIFKSITSIDPGYSMRILRKGLLYQLLFYYVTVTVMSSPKYTRRIPIILMIAVTLVSSVGLIGYFSGELVKSGRATSFYSSFGLAAFFTAMVMPIALSHFLCTTGWRRTIALLVLVICLGFMLVTLSRGAWFSSLLAVSILAAIKDRRMLVLLLIGVISAPWFLPPDILLRATSISSLEALKNNETFGDRVWMWRSAILMIKERPWLGAGYGNRIFQILYPEYMFSQSSGVVFENAHNLYLQTLVETGILGLTSFFIIVMGIFYLIFIQFRYKPLPVVESQLLGFAASFAVFLTFSFTTFRFEKEIGILFWILAGCVVSLYRSRSPLSGPEIDTALDFYP